MTFCIGTYILIKLLKEQDKQQWQDQPCLLFQKASYHGLRAQEADATETTKTVAFIVFSPNSYTGDWNQPSQILRGDDLSLSGLQFSAKLMARQKMLTLLQAFTSILPCWSTILHSSKVTFMFLLSLRWRSITSNLIYSKINNAKEPGKWSFKLSRPTIFKNFIKVGMDDIGQWHTWKYHWF